MLKVTRRDLAVKRQLTMGLTVAPSLPPLLFSLSMPNTTTTGQFGSLFRTVLSFFSLSFSANFFMNGSGVRRCERGFNIGEGGE
jgi:hypothetical protein